MDYSFSFDTKKLGMVQCVTFQVLTNNQRNTPLQDEMQQDTYYLGCD